MNILNRLSIGVKLLLAPMTILALLMILAATSYYGLSQQQSALDNIFLVRFNNFKLASESAAKSQETYARTYQLLSSIAASFTASRLDVMSKELQAGLALIDKQTREIGSEGGLSAEEKDVLEKVTKQLAVYRKSTIDVIDVSMADSSTGATMMALTQKEFAKLSQAMSELLTIEQKLSNDAYDQAKVTANLVTKTVAIVVALSIVMALLVSFAVRGQIVTAIEKIKTAAMVLKSGDLTSRVTVGGSDEIAQTARAFNDLIDSFQRAVQNVLGAARDVSGASKLLATSSKSVASSSSRQADSAAAVAATMEEMAGNISSIAENAHQAKDTSRQSLDNTQAGSDSLERLLADIKRVKEAFQAITASVGEFVRSTRSITNMTQQVKELADQTNLLALNAAIEAARAGEQGRGFAVVADEVRKLAERSSSAANEIDNVTKELERQSVVVEESLDAGTSSLGSSEGHMQELERVIGSVRESVTRANCAFDEIATAVGEQSAESNDIARNIDEIVRMVQENNSTVAQVSVASEELRGHAEKLQVAVGIFRA